MTAVSQRRPARYEWLRPVGALAFDIPLFLTAPLYRRWHLRWGATPDEVAQMLPGDHLLPHAQFQPTRAITIDAPPEAVWPWLVQVGCNRAGWYSNDLMDNLGHPSAREIIDDFQHLEVGQWVSMSAMGSPTEVNAFRVADYEVNRWLLWTKPDSTWVWQLTPTEHGRTRLVTRVHAPRDWRHKPGMALLGLLLMEFGDFAMMRRMLLGLKQRAEHHPALPAPPGLVVQRQEHHPVPSPKVTLTTMTATGHDSTL